METPKKYAEDLLIAESLIARDERLTRQYFYKQCYPLFKSIYDNYHTDCESVIEFISEIYMVILSPSRATGKCQMDNFRGDSSLASWIKSACLFYCYKKYKRKQQMPKVEQLQNPNDEKFDDSDRILNLGGSSNIDDTDLNRSDVESLLQSMHNKRYSNLLRLRYLEHKTDAETAEALGINMSNYYNVHKRAKAQYESACRKEENNG